MDEARILETVWTSFFKVCENRWMNKNVAYKHRALQGNLPPLPTCLDMLRVGFELEQLWSRAEALIESKLKEGAINADDPMPIGAAQLLNDTAYWSFVTTLVLRSGQVAKLKTSESSLESLSENIRLGKVSDTQYTVIISKSKTLNPRSPSRRCVLPERLSVLLAKLETLARPVLVSSLPKSKMHDGLFTTHTGLALCPTLEKGKGAVDGAQTAPAAAPAPAPAPASAPDDKARYLIDTAIAGIGTVLREALPTHKFDTQRYMGRLISHTNCRTSCFKSSCDKGQILDMLGRGERFVRARDSSRTLDAHLRALPEYAPSLYDLPEASPEEKMEVREEIQMVNKLSNFAMSSETQMNASYDESMMEVRNLLLRSWRVPRTIRVLFLRTCVEPKSPKMTMTTKSCGRC
jgi:hypothetical protein